MAVGHSIDDHFAGDSSTDERFMFPDPFDKMAINCTTRYRAKKRRRGEDSDATAGPTGSELAAHMYPLTKETVIQVTCVIIS